MNGLKDKLVRFMYGRYGTDRLNRFVMFLSVVFLLLSLFTIQLFYTLALVGIVLVYFRMLSKNIARRAAENRVYLGIEAKVKAFFRKKWAAIKQMNTHHIYKCPSCRQKIRIPRGRGKIEISCPKCRHTFIKRS